MAELTPTTELPAVPPRPLDAHKGTFGTVVVVGGSLMMVGAPALCAKAALRGGAGLVKVATLAAPILPHVFTIEPGATGILLQEDTEASTNTLAKVDPENRAVLAIGPGLGMSEQVGRLVLELLGGARRMVLDADGLNLLAGTGRPRPSRGGELILTPHPGEFERLAWPLGIKDRGRNAETRASAAAELAMAHRAIVVLKGQNTVVTDGKRVYVNQTGNPALATAGTGDVLTGLIASLMAQGLAIFRAAVLGVYLHGLAADLWAQDRGLSGLSAVELADRLPDAFSQHRRKK